MLALWIPIVLVSILVHEYGHALAIMRHGIEPEIALHWMGGSTTWRQTLPISRFHRVIISLAGPFAGVYPQAAPGGWQLVGRTDAVLFDVDRDPPALLTPGTTVRFRNGG